MTYVHVRTYMSRLLDTSQRSQGFINNGGNNITITNVADGCKTSKSVCINESRHVNFLATQAPSKLYTYMLYKSHRRKLEPIQLKQWRFMKL